MLMQDMHVVDQVDEHIRRELERARIPVKEAGPHTDEIPYTIIGQLGDITFTRGAYCWDISGNVPLEVAQELFADPVGVTDIRSYGDCQPPETRTVRITDDGKKVYQAGEEEIWPELAEDDALISSDDPSARAAKMYVTSYSVYSEVGLRIFVDTLKAHGLVPEPANN